MALAEKSPGTVRGEVEKREIEEQRLEALRSYIQLVEKSGLPLEKAVGSDFARLASTSVKEHILAEVDVGVQREYSIDTPFGPFLYNSGTRVVVSPLRPEGNRAFTLSPLEGKVLERLITYPGIVIKRDDLFEVISGKRKLEALATLVSRVRRRIGDSKIEKSNGVVGYRLIHTVPVEGFYFLPVV